MKPKRESGGELARAELHESGLRHTRGEALYVDDLPEPPGTLFLWPVVSPHAHARITRRDGTTAYAMPGVRAVLFAEDIPGHNQVGPVIHDEPLLAEDFVFAEGQIVAVVAAYSPTLARKAAAAVDISYEPLEAILSIQAGRAKGSFLSEPHVIARGDVAAAMSSAPLVVSGEFTSGAQDHFYLETQAAFAIPEEGDAVHVYSSTQHPSEVQAKVAEVLGLGRHRVNVEVPRMGGGFGGKETQAASFAALAALVARLTRCPAKFVLNRDQDMVLTGKRHPFLAEYRAGFDRLGRLLALEAKLWSDGGWSNDLSRSIMDRALFHLDNGYFIPACRLEGRVVRTNLPSNTAFRGFGGPQGMLVMEAILSEAAETLGLDPATVRQRNFYGDAPRNLTHYGQAVEENRLPRLSASLLETSDYVRRREAILRENRTSPWVKRGIAFSPVKFGISFTASFLNQAGALVSVFADGTVQMNHGGTEMGQGLQTKMLSVCAQALGVARENIRAMPTSTEKVPNTSATAASSGSDLNGQAVRLAAEAIRERMRPVAQRLLNVPDEEAWAIAFENGLVRAGARTVSFAEVAAAAYLAQVSLSSTGFYRTPDLAYDRVRGEGRPFHYFAFGAAVVECEVNGLTGEHRLLRVDILHDVGDSLVPTIDLGQIEGGFVQGLGWLTQEEVIYDQEGHLRTHSPDTYKIPAAGDVPEDFRVHLFEGAPASGVIYGSKAVGEPPLMLAIAAWLSLRAAVAGFGAAQTPVRLAAPATPEAILRAIEHASAR